MNRFITTIAFSLLVFSACNTIDRDLNCPTRNNIMNTKSGDGIYYHRNTDLFIRPITKAGECLSLNDSTVTHIARKFYPESIDEQFKIANDPDISVSYIPFGYIPLGKMESRSLNKESVPEYDEENTANIVLNRRDALIDYLPGAIRQADNNDIEVSLPVMYAICPVGHNDLQDIRHTDCYGLCLAGPGGGMINEIRFPIQLNNYDTLLDTLAPLPCVKITAQYGNHLVTIHTSSEGYADINLHFVDITDGEMGNFSITLSLETPKWIVTRNSSTTPIHINLGTVSELWPFYLLWPVVYTDNLVSQSEEFEIQRAAYHYHYVEHDLSSTIKPYESGVVIHAMSDSNASYAGMTIAINKYIEICNYTTLDNYLIGTVLHELGHVRQYANMDQSYGFVSRIVKESYASFVGWYVSEDYYLSHGFTKPYPSYHINAQDRQDWYPNISSTYYPYSPLFVDMVDSLNQSTIDPVYLYDTIQGTPVPTVEQMGWECYSLSDCWNYLDNYSGIYYSASQLNSYMSQYFE